MKKLMIAAFLLFGISVLGTEVLAYGPNNYLCWIPPTTNVDQTALTNLASYKVYWGSATGNYVLSKNVGNPAAVQNCNGVGSSGVTGVQLGTLGISDGTIFVAVTAINTGGNESAYSNEISGPFVGAVPKPPAGLGFK